MGCWAIGGQWGAVSDRQAIRTVHAALGAGVYLFDTADSCGLGQSEILLGKVPSPVGTTRRMSPPR